MISKFSLSAKISLFALFAFTANLTAATPVISSVVNAANFQSSISRTTWVAITGTNLSTTTRTWTSTDIVSGKLPTSLDGVSVTINGKSCAVYYVSPTQINVLSPADDSTGTVPVVLTNSSGTASSTATLKTTAPALFTSSKGGKNYDAAETTSYTTISRSNPVAPGDTVILYGTGFGKTTPAVDPLSDYSGAAVLTDLSNLTVTIGGKSAVVLWAGLVGNGLYQINATVPSGVSDGDAAVSASITGTSTSVSSYLQISSTRKQIQTKVACLGDSITAITDYVSVLQTQLGSNFTVSNYGVPGSTVLLNSGHSYYSQSGYQSAKAALPDVIVIMLGTNDTASSTYTSIANFPSDYKTMISELQNLSSHPQIWLVKSPPIYTNTLGLSNANLLAGVIPGITQTASDNNLPTIDAYTPLTNHSEYFSDGIHPNTAGATIIATQVSAAIQ